MSQVIALSALKAGPKPASGCKSASCGSAKGPGDMPPEVWARVKEHPCYNEEAHHYFARMHVAVAPACNIQCNYCNRKYDCANESRPGVTSERLTPEQAVRKVTAVAAKMPQLSVLGVAGPGDALFDADKTFETFERVRAVLPDLRFCLSTNGLALPDNIDRIVAAGIDHVTITISAVDPEIGAKIYPWIYFQGKRHTGVEAARILLARQIEGLEGLVAKGVLVKVNTVLIPGINDHHIKAVNDELTKRGVFLHNVLPLISDPAHGTAFGLSGQRGPTPAELSAVQDQLGGSAGVMRHCRQCRADAVGLLGEDLSQDFTLDKLGDIAVPDPEPRRLYREVVERERADRQAAARSATAGLSASSSSLGARRVAVCTKGGGRVNVHFGHATEFQIFEIDGNGVRFTGHRKVENYCQGGYGEDERMDGILAALSGIEAVFVSKIGRCPKEDLAKAGIAAIDAYPFDYIETAIAAWYAELGVQGTRLTA